MNKTKDNFAERHNANICEACDMLYMIAVDLLNDHDDKDGAGDLPMGVMGWYLDRCRLDLEKAIDSNVSPHQMADLKKSIDRVETLLASPDGDEPVIQLIN